MRAWGPVIGVLVLVGGYAAFLAPPHGEVRGQPVVQEPLNLSGDWWRHDDGSPVCDMEADGVMKLVSRIQARNGGVPVNVQAVGPASAPIRVFVDAGHSSAIFHRAAESCSRSALAQFSLR